MVKIEFYSFWPGCGTFLLEYFKGLIGELEQYDIIQVWSVFGGSPIQLNTNPKILTIQWSGESYCHDINKFNINLIAEKESSNVISYIQGMSDVLIHSFSPSLTKLRINQNKLHFCNFMVSNGGCVERNNFFHELSKYKQVDSCGPYLKNWTSEVVPQRDSYAYFEFLTKWKFMICFENKKQTYYCTEKLINAYLGDCIPIYWGCPQTKEIFNEKAILFLEENTPECVEKLIKKIIELDNDDELYNEMFNQPLFVNNIIHPLFTFEHYRQEIKNKIK